MPRITGLPAISCSGMIAARHLPKICGRPSLVSDPSLMKCLEVRMKNLNEPRKRDNEVIPFEHRPSPQRDRTAPLLPTRQIDDLHERWTLIQSSFVDEPRKAVEEA